MTAETRKESPAAAVPDVKAAEAGASEAGAGASTDAVEQAGFRQLYEIREGLSPACSICMNECGYARRPTFMRCVHFACEDCLITWLNYQRAQALRDRHHVDLFRRRVALHRLPWRHRACALC